MQKIGVFDFIGVKLLFPKLISMRLSLTTFKLSLLFLLTGLAVNFITAQQNGGFENWSPSGSPPPFDWKFPTGWTTTNATTEFITAGVTRNTYHYSGEFAAQIKTLNIFGTYTRSQLALGNCKLDYPHYQVKAWTGGEALSMLPQKVSFFYQLTIGDPVEYAVADILIKHPNGSSSPDTVFYQSVKLPAVDIYTEVNVPIPEAGINIATDSIVILFSSNDTNEIAPNILYVDDVSIDFVSATDPGQLKNEAMVLYPNPVRSGEILNIVFPENKIHDLKILDLTGRIAGGCCDIIVEENYARLGPVHLASGIYCVIADGKFSSRFVVCD
jgi:hypothetical protein